MNMIVTVRVGVATARPPRLDAFIHTIVSVEIPENMSLTTAEQTASLIAAQMSFFHPHVVMPVSTQIMSIEL